MSVYLRFTDEKIEAQGTYVILLRSHGRLKKKKKRQTVAPDNLGSPPPMMWDLSLLSDRPSRPLQAPVAVPPPALSGLGLSIGQIPACQHPASWVLRPSFSEFAIPTWIKPPDKVA